MKNQVNWVKIARKIAPHLLHPLERDTDTNQDRTLTTEAIVEAIIIETEVEAMRDIIENIRKEVTVAAQVGARTVLVIEVPKKEEVIIEEMITTVIIRRIEDTISIMNTVIADRGAGMKREAESRGVKATGSTLIEEKDLLIVIRNKACFPQTAKIRDNKLSSKKGKHRLKQGLKTHLIIQRIDKD